AAVVDNGATYLAVATLAAGDRPLSALAASEDGGVILQAISCGAVFMGAMTYIGNGPNFMVKAISEESGYPTPSFFAYVLVACLVLVPVFVAVTLVFFPPG